MKPINIPETNFDFDGFVNAICRFLSRDLEMGKNPSAAIVALNKADGKIHFPPEKGRDNLRVDQQDATLFYLFTGGGGDEIDVLCADGVVRGQSPRRIEGEFYIDELDAAGYLVELRDGVFRIEGAKFTGSEDPEVADSLDVVTDLGKFDQPMAGFIQRFIRK